MSPSLQIDEELIPRLPLPLAQLYRRAKNSKEPSNRYLSAYYLWEASLKLLGSVAIVSYADCDAHDAAVVERLTNLARPSLGHWWEFVRLLAPRLAQRGDPHFDRLHILVQPGAKLNDSPGAAQLCTALVDGPDGKKENRSVNLFQLFERLVEHRNREIGHGAVGQRDKSYYQKMAELLLAGASELLSRLHVLAGRRLVYVDEVHMDADRVGPPRASS
jgi:hypothetical protein